MTDEEIVEMAAMVLKPAAWRDDVPEQWRERQPILRDIARQNARAVLAAVRPVIEAEERERCAKVADEYSELWGRGPSFSADVRRRAGTEIASAIRAQQAHDEPQEG